MWYPLIEIGYQRGMRRTQKCTMSPSRRRLGADREEGFVLGLDFLQDVGLHRAAQPLDDVFLHLLAGFGAGLRAVEVPVQLAADGGGDELRHQDRRGAVDRHRNGGGFRRQVEARVEALHVLDGGDGHAALADFSEHAFLVGVHAVERGAVEGRREAVRLLALGEELEALVGVLGQAEAREHARRLFADVVVLFDDVLLRIGGEGVGEAARQALLAEVAHHGPGLVEERQRDLGHGRADEGVHGGHGGHAVAPFAHDALADGGVLARALDLKRRLRVVLLDAGNAFVQETHQMVTSVVPWAPAEARATTRAISRR
jgi:hypothetical protein